MEDSIQGLLAIWKLHRSIEERNQLIRPRIEARRRLHQLKKRITEIEEADQANEESTNVVQRGPSSHGSKRSYQSCNFDGKETGGTKKRRSKKAKKTSNELVQLRGNLERIRGEIEALERDIHIPQPPPLFE